MQSSLMPVYLWQLWQSNGLQWLQLAGRKGLLAALLYLITSNTLLHSLLFYSPGSQDIKVLAISIAGLYNRLEQTGLRDEWPLYEKVCIEVGIIGHCLCISSWSSVAFFI